MDTLTLARFICELSLLEMEFVSVRASLLASACLLIALVTKDLGGWVRVYLYNICTNTEITNYTIYSHKILLLFLGDTHTSTFTVSSASLCGVIWVFCTLLISLNELKLMTASDCSLWMNFCSHTPTHSHT